MAKKKRITTKKKVSKGVKPRTNSSKKVTKMVSRELHGIIKSLDENLKKSQQSINNTLSSTYEYLDTAVTQFDRVIEEQTSIDKPVNSGATEQFDSEQGMYSEMHLAQQTIGKSLEGVNQGLQSASGAYLSAEQTLNDQLSEMPPHLASAMQAVQQSVNRTAAALQRGIEERNAAMQHMMELQEPNEPTSADSN